MHARTIVTIKRLRHEGGALPVTLSDVTDRVFEELQVVSGAKKIRVAKVDLTLSGSGQFVMMAFNLNAHLLELSGYFRAKVLQGVQWGKRYIAFFIANVISEI